jgi:hypothetical protein
VAVVQYTFTHKQHTEYRERNKKKQSKDLEHTQQSKHLKLIWEVRAGTRLCELYPGICLMAEEKARENLS